MAALGARGALPGVGGFSLAVKSDVFLVRTTSDALAAPGAGNLAAGEAGASRVRAALEASRALRFAGRSLTPSVELGVRWDGGDAETGLGLETGFGVAYSDPKLGLTVDATLNVLAARPALAPHLSAGLVARVRAPRTRLGRCEDEDRGTI